MPCFPFYFPMKGAFMPRVPRILVVDDVLDIAELLSVFLSRAGGYETLTANNGFEAVRIAEEFRPDVILLDIGMPNVDGFATAKRIRSKPWGKDMLFIGMSGHFDSKRYERRAYEAGFEQYLSKPVSLNSILDAIQVSRPHLASASRLPALYSPPKAATRAVHPVSLRAVFSRN